MSTIEDSAPQVADAPETGNAADLVTLMPLDEAVQLTRNLVSLRTCHDPLNAARVQSDCAVSDSALGLIGLSDLRHAPSLVRLLACTPACLHHLLCALGVLLLAPSVRQTITGSAFRAALAELGPLALELIRQTPSDPLWAQLQGNSRCDYGQVKGLGCDAAPSVAVRWLAPRASAVSPTLWAHLRQRFSPITREALAREPGPESGDEARSGGLAGPPLDQVLDALWSLPNWREHRADV